MAELMLGNDEAHRRASGCRQETRLVRDSEQHVIGQHHVGLLNVLVFPREVATIGLRDRQPCSAVDVGPIEVTAANRKHVSLPPVLGGVALVVGAVLLVSGAKRGRS